MSPNQPQLGSLSNHSACSDKGPQPVNPSWLTAMLLLGPLSVFGELLIEKTNHRPLGAATFATVALILWFTTEIISRRILDPSASPSRARARKAAWVLGITASAAVMLRALL